MQQVEDDSTLRLQGSRRVRRYAAAAAALTVALAVSAWLLRSHLSSPVQTSPPVGGMPKARVITSAEVDAFLAPFASHVPSLPAAPAEASPPPAEIPAVAGATPPPSGAPQPFAEGGGLAWPPPASAANTPYLRASVGRHAMPPFGPQMMPLMDGAEIAAWERTYYEARPEEYARFVELFGDVHALR